MRLIQTYYAYAKYAKVLECIMDLYNYVDWRMWKLVVTGVVGEGRWGRWRWRSSVTGYVIKKRLVNLHRDERREKRKRATSGQDRSTGDECCCCCCLWEGEGNRKRMSSRRRRKRRRRISWLQQETTPDVGLCVYIYREEIKTRHAPLSPQSTPFTDLIPSTGTYLEPCTAHCVTNTLCIWAMNISKPNTYIRHVFRVFRLL